MDNTKKISKVDYAVALRKSAAYFSGDELAANVWVNKYALKDSDGNLYESSPSEMHERLANEIVRIESKYVNAMPKDVVLSLLDHFRYIIPQGGPMAGIGNNFQAVSLSNCFVIGHNDENADSYGAIFRMDEEQVQLMKRRGGVGHDLSHIRPAGSPVLNSALTSTGVVPFMERFSNSTREVAQGGRRGALMLSISVKHPDAEAFIDAKVDTTKVTGANVSIKLDDDFMRCVNSGEKYVQQFPVDASVPKVKREVDARNLWRKIIHNAWKSAEPGCLFWDTIIRESVADCYAAYGFKTLSTNPCGELPLCAYDSCRLLSLNLYSYVKNPFSGTASFDFDLFKEHVGYAMRMMDDIVDLEVEKVDQIIDKIKHDPESESLRRVELELWQKIRQKALLGRRCGLGITAEGDMLAALGLTYGSNEAIDFATEVHKVLAIEAYRESTILAKERGAFSMYNYKLEENNPFIQRLREADPALYEDMVHYGRRNIAMLTIAPTGTTSLMSQTTSGIEPVFRVAYKRRRKVNPSDHTANIAYRDEVGDAFEEYYVMHHKFIEWLRVSGYDVDNILSNAPEKVITELVSKSPYANATANDIDWVAKVKMQGAIQKWVDHSISVTVNLPNNVSEELVADVYKTAWECGCKGITVYRDGSRNGVLVETKDKKVDDGRKVGKRPKELECEVMRFKNEREDWIAFVGLKDGMPYEIFTGKVDAEDMFIPKNIKRGTIIKVKESDGAKRYDFKYVDKDGFTNIIGGISRLFDMEFWNYAKLISGVLRHGMPIESVVNLIRSLQFTNDGINVWKAGVARALKHYIKDGTKSTEKCPHCGQSEMAYQNGCLTCMACGYSKCS